MVKIDVNKTSRVWDLMKSRGEIWEPGQTPAEAPEGAGEANGVASGILNGVAPTNQASAPSHTSQTPTTHTPSLSHTPSNDPDDFLDSPLEPSLDFGLDDFGMGEFVDLRA